MKFWLDRCVGVATAILLLSSPLLSVCVMVCGPSMAHHTSAASLPPSGHEHHAAAGPQLVSGQSGHQTDDAEHHHHAEPASHGASGPVFGPTIRARVDCCIAVVAAAIAALPASRADGFPTPLAVVGLTAVTGEATLLSSVVSPATHTASPPAPPRVARVLRI